ncbi:unnamed protein product [Rhizopus stolonifer]
MQRRRSFDGQTDTKSLKPNPMPTASVSARVSHIPAGRGVQKNTVPYPRGGAQIGTSDDDSNNIVRSSSIGRNSFQTEEHPPRKKNFFRRGKKKRPSSSSSAVSAATNLPINSSGMPALRKKGNDIDHKYASDSVDNQKIYFSPQKEERKKSSSSSGRKGKLEHGKSQFLQLKLDQNFERMDDIVNPDYYKETSPFPQFTIDNFSTGMNIDSWSPPDSWDVQPASFTPTDNLALDDEHTGFEHYQIEDQENVKHTNIKVFRPDQTYNTLHVPLNITTSEILKKLTNKFFMGDMNKYNLAMKRYKNERILGLNEYPVKIQTEFQEKMGYTNDDTIDDISYLIRFQLVPNASKYLKKYDKEFGEYVDLQSRSLATIPIYLYEHTLYLKTLDVSSNSRIGIPLDFLQTCVNLETLHIANNEYEKLPASIHERSSLQHLNISGNQLKNLEQSKLDRLTNLSTLNLINNKLSDLPSSFGTCFKQLTSLYISNNEFVTFPSVVCNITSLLRLDISFNKIREFPPEIGQLIHLTALFAIASHIKGALPQSFMKLTELQELDIRQNFITDLEVVSHLPKLEILSVDYNSSSIINFEIKNLKELKVYKNHLTQFNLFSATGGHCLTELNLSNCKLSSLPENLFENTRGLKRLVLDSNTLSTLPSSIDALQKLTKLSIQNNYLETLPSEIGRLAKLRSIDAQKNNLKSLPKEIWLCASLSTLNCSSNLLGSFPEPYSATNTLPVLNKPSDVDSYTINNTSHVLNTMPGPQLNAGQGTIQRINTSFKFSTSIAPQTPLEPPQSCNFNPPSFFESPRNHPPPLSLSLQHLFLGDNRLTDEIWVPLSLFSELRTLNLSFNDLYEIPSGGLRYQLYELYLSGNQFTSLPADNIEKLQFLRVLAVNGNKLQTLPAEIGKLRKLIVLDVGNNVLKYNISNWPYDWNWNWNLILKYLNLSGNKRLKIQKAHPDPNNPKDKDLSDFSALTKLRMLGLMDVTILGVSTPDENPDRRVRTSPSEVNSMSYGVADWLGPADHLSTWDLVMPRFQSKEDECLFALFDASKHPKGGCLLTKKLNDKLICLFTEELTKNEDTIVSAIRRTFLSLEQHIGSFPGIDPTSGASAAMCYISGTKLYVANVGDVLVVISRNNGQAFEITQKHIPLNPSEASRIHNSGGHVSNSGLLKNELNVSRSFGHFHLVPAVNCNPFVSTIELSENDEFVIMASRGLWDKMTYQTAVDIARTEKEDLMSAAQKLRDFAITYGASDNLMVMVIGVGDLFNKRDKRFRKTNINAGRMGPDGGMEDVMLMKSSKRRGKEEIPGDSTLARLEREVAPPVSQMALVFTDIKSSTQFWETQPENMRAAIKIHDSIMRRTLRSVGGYEVKTEGDAFMVCFKNITAALLWCFTVQLQLLEADWPAGIVEPDEGKLIKDSNNVVLYNGLSVRMGIHWGTPVSERNPITQRMDYFGPVVNKASRISNVADGGQICISSDVITALRNFPSMFNDDAELEEAPDENEGSFPISRDLLQLKKLGFHIVELGERRLKGLETPENLSLIFPKQLVGRIATEEDKTIKSSEQQQPEQNPLEQPSSEQPSSEQPSSEQPSLEQHPLEPHPLEPHPLEPHPLEPHPLEQYPLEQYPLEQHPLDQYPFEQLPLDVSLSPNPSTMDIVSNVMDKPLYIASLPPTDYLNARPITHNTPRAIDPNMVCAMNSIAFRLERLTSGKILYEPKTEISEDYIHEHPLDNVRSSFDTIVQTNFGATLDRHLREEATDEELIFTMENCVSRVENATSSLFMQKIGKFANVLEKLSEAIEVDPMHIMKALQMYAELAPK